MNGTQRTETVNGARRTMYVRPLRSGFWQWEVWAYGRGRIASGLRDTESGAFLAAETAFYSR